MKHLLCTLLFGIFLQGKEIALSFDDAPMSTSKHFETLTRTDMLLKALKELQVPPVMIFANPCKRENSSSVISQLKKYKDAGHFIGNHTCSHPRLDDVGYTEYIKDTKKADDLLFPLFVGQKFFRFPFLNEGKEEKTRDQMRTWLKENNYRNGMISIDNDDHIFSFKINQAKERGKKFNYSKVKKLFIEHLISAVNFYDDLALKTLGYSPKHVLLLHEMDATVMFIRPLIKELRKQGWKIISIQEAYKDKIYFEQPKNIYANNGIIDQMAMEKNGYQVDFNHIDTIKSELNKILGLE
ncbi:MAG: polysaccharide deacetylase family protein [Bdellovibrionaceae bacterium]|nr:polysaccharide deacetylase family protein [Pseudobdellovibrionaceae bacterium]NUM58722.1 polysaccharide deacetylase family protein [Pseudobdellovibrionaceae bacterium]